jgi:hypothetical protein
MLDERLSRRCLLQLGALRAAQCLVKPIFSLFAVFERLGSPDIVARRLQLMSASREGKAAMGRTLQLCRFPAIALLITFVGQHAHAQPVQGAPTSNGWLNEGAYSPTLEARSRRIFPWVSQEEERQKWMAMQEQQLIANGINRTKPLSYPAQ